jgi:hypothetical protein
VDILHSSSDSYLRPVYFTECHNTYICFLKPHVATHTGCYYHNSHRYYYYYYYNQAYLKRSGYGLLLF